jgi:tripartite ATP-independent transporter DctM subunit
MNATIIGAIIIIALLLGIVSGHALAFVLGGVAMLVALLFWGPESVYSMLAMTYGIMDNFVMVAVPLFILMAMVLERAGVATAMYNSVHKWSGPLRGGLAVATVVVCTAFAACTGIASAGVVSMGVIALPQMLEHGYDKGLSMGCIMAGGTLGQLIPPSVTIIIYGVMAHISVGQMLAGGLAAGLILSGLFIMYILVRCYLQKDLGPAIPSGERASLPMKIASLRALVLPALLITAVLGTIFSGVATPTEASAVGAIGAFLCAGISHKLNWKLINGSVTATIKLSAMIGWMMIGAACFSSGFIGSGGARVIEDLLMVLGGGSKWGILIMALVILFLLGMIIDPTAMILIVVPILTPLMERLGFDMLWFGLLFMVMIQIAFISPPFGYSLFFMRGVAPESITMSDIYASAWPFVAIQTIGLVIFVVFPESMLWLPHLLFK